MPVDPRSPCIVGVAQRTWHLGGTECAPEPLEMLAEVVPAAAADAAASGDVLAAVGSLAAVYCMSWPYDDLPARLAERLGIAPAHLEYSAMSGTVPQQLLGAAAARITAGDLDVAVVGGAEALDTVRRLKKAEERPAWSHRNPEKVAFPFEAPFHPAEIAHEVFQAWLTFAVRDVARRAALGVDPGEYRRRIGRLLAPLTAVAATNPHAWFPTVRTPDELVVPTPANRMVGYPYTRDTVAIMDVDMAAAVVVASHAAADRLGVPADRRVYLRGWAEGRDPVYLAEHPDLPRSAAMPAVFGATLGMAGVGIDDVVHLDLYSCFASSVHFACDALGVDPLTDPRPLTVTGGLPYCGGPASNYQSHSLGRMVEALRADPGSLGLVSGVGMHMTKHIAGVYSTVPPDGPVAPPAGFATGEPVRRPIVDRVDGDATVDSYSVVHGRDGEPAWGLVVVSGPSGERGYGRVEDPEVLAAMEATEGVGATVTLKADDGGVNRLVDWSP